MADYTNYNERAVLSGSYDEVSSHLKTSLNTTLAGEVPADDKMEVEERSTSLGGITSSQIVKTGPGRLKGFYVSSTTGGTIKFWNGTSATGPVLIDTFTPAVGFCPLPGIEFGIGCYITIANTINCSVFTS